MKKILLLISFAMVIISPVNSNGYMPQNTHPLINEAALKASTVNSVLIERLGFANGIEEKFNNAKIWESIRQGGTDEDNNVRGVYHFHDPTKSWDQAGILGIAYSSLLWAQDHTSGITPNCQALGIQCSETCNSEWSWPASRTYYYQALTSANKGDRDEKFGKTFLTLGHVMHLLADAAVPEHSRNDQHMMFPFGSRYERWAEDIGVSSGALSSFIQDNYMLYPVDYSVITSKSNIDGYIPISNFWDTTPAGGYGGTLLGLAEYTNYNFLSPGTIFKNYTYPVNTQTTGHIQAVYDIDMASFEERVYFSGSTSDGRPIEHLVSAGYLWSDLGNDMYTAKFQLDENCFYDYASILVPKAVDYDAALLDYFFRGTLAVAPRQWCFAITNPTGSFSTIREKYGLKRRITS